MNTTDTVLIFFGGIFAGFVNSMAGGGSLLTVPLLVSIAGLEGLIANGTNRVAVLIQNISSGAKFATSKLVPAAEVVPVVLPALVGGLIGAVAVSGLDDEVFKRLFGLLMIPLLVLSLFKPASKAGVGKKWPWWLTTVVFFALGMYAGAIQAGVGLIMLLTLARSGYDLVSGNAIKSYIIIGVSLIAVPVFVLQDQVRWVPALILSGGMAIGGYVGAKAAIDGGEKLVRPVLVCAVLALAGRMLGLY